MGNMCCAGPITDNFFEAVPTTLCCCVAAGTEEHCAAPVIQMAVAAPNPPPSSQVMETGGLVWVLPHKTENVRKIYTLHRKLGRGSFGTTSLCVEKATGKKYACKSITKKELDTEELEYVRSEIEIMHHLSGRHPNIISIKGAYEDDTAVHLVMDLCAGGGLLDRVRNGKHYSEGRAAEIARVIMDVVAACHSLGVMHRDLKPDNFLFASKNQTAAELVAIDFGLSVFFRPGDVFSDVDGSLHYVAPEVFRQRHGPEADVWSAGVIIYMLLTGLTPFSAKNEADMYEETMNGTLDLESEPWPSISESAKDLVRKILSKDPRNRLTAHQALCHPWLTPS